jgi:hypothetical protein
MKQQRRDLIYLWVLAQKPERAFVGSLRRRGASAGNQALARRIATPSKAR